MPLHVPVLTPVSVSGGGTARVPRPRGDHADAAGGGRGDAAVPHRALRQPVRLAPLRPRRPPGRRRGPRRGRRRHRLPAGRGRVHRRRHRGRQRRDRRRPAPLRRAAPCARPPSTTPCCTSSSATGGTVVAGRRAGRSTRPRCGRARRRAHRPGRSSAWCRSWRSTTRSASITDLAAVAAARALSVAPAAVLHTDAVQAAVLARPARDVAARRPAVAERPQVRRTQGRRACSSCATASRSSR